jgi:hydrocephalus-inducing protein
MQMSRLSESRIPADQPLFQAFPPHVTFQGYEPGRSYEQKIAFRNNDKVPLRICLIDPTFRLRR